MTRFESRSADWLTVDQARSRILDRASPLEPREVPLHRALGTALARPVAASATLPPWDNSAMDGYAVRAADVEGARADAPVVLRVTGEVRAGEAASARLGPGEAIRIMTGAPVPPGADSVVRVEHTDAEQTPGSVEVLDAGDAGRNVRPGGEDMRKGDAVFGPGTTLGPGQVGVLAALGLGQISVHGSATVAILSNGDELVPLDRFDEVLAGRAIPESNSHALAAAIQELGGEAIRLGIAADTESSVEAGLRRALSSTADVLLTVAGASMGETDLFKRVLDVLGFELDFWRVQMRPGSPFSFGLLPREEGPPLHVFGLPGNPASAFVNFWVLVRPFLLALAGHRRIHAPVLRARAGSRLTGARDLTVFLRVQLASAGDGIVATLTGPQGSGLVRSLGQADGIAVIPGGVEAVEVGQSVEVLLLRPGSGWSERPEFTATLL